MNSKWPRDPTADPGFSSDYTLQTPTLSKVAPHSRRRLRASPVLLGLGAAGMLLNVSHVERTWSELGVGVELGLGVRVRVGVR
eukprot:scaffold49224_cov84-Phaeocystis_antarctica.AAC.1